MGIQVGVTATKSKEHHQSPKAVVATVTGIASNICKRKNLKLDPNPQRRCIWHGNGSFYVSVRNLDGAIPSLENPVVVWEIKEYWGKTKGGSKMSDAVYECNIFGREIVQYRESIGRKVWHVVFLDGQVQWSFRKSDMSRFLDLECQGLIDRIFIGKEIETELSNFLNEILY